MRQPSRIFKGKIGNGKIWLECRADFAALIQKLEGLDVEVILRKLRRKRSLKQNAYYWAVIVPMFQEAVPFDTPDEAHQALKMQFLTDRTKRMPTIRSTTSLDTAEESTYIESCRNLYRSMFDAEIPDPLRAAEMGFTVSE
jgi:hypothetical protein